MKYNVIKDGQIINTIMWDGVTPYELDEGCTLELYVEETE